MIATSLISYVLLQRYFYTKRYAQFVLAFVCIVISVILIEEFVLEQIYFPDTRGSKFLFYYGLMDVLPIITILCGFKFAWDALTKQSEVENLQLVIQESELQFLKSQINPHFLFNNLNNLYSYAIEQSPKTPQIILELSSVLRYMLYDCRSEYVALDKEVAHLEHFTQLSELQIEDRGVINFTTRNIQSNYRIAPLILIVFIENAFKHSQASQANNIRINISIELSTRGELKFRCQNSFRPIKNNQNLAKGIGLENVCKRLDLLYPNTHQLDIQTNDMTYDVQLTLQLERL
jgi:LytS/YehU family sensor histidine kinase